MESPGAQTESLHRHAARSAARGASRGAARVRAAIRSGGAAESGLDKLIELHAVHSAGDALIAVGLAGTLFFSVPTGEARGRVALYLLITMAPFALVAPVVGPVLDRFRHGRRYAMAATMFGRAVLAYFIARALATSTPLALYPAAFGILVLSRAYGISRSAAVPRVLPAGATLVQANAKLSLAGSIAAAVAAPLGAGVVWALSGAWCLRLAMLVFLFAGFVALRVPSKVNSRAGETQLARRPLWPGFGRLLPSPRTVGPAVAGVLRSAAALRALNGFVILFVAFLARDGGLSGLGDKLTLGLFAIALTGGGLAGTALGARMQLGAPVLVSTIVVAASTAACLVAALSTGLVTVLVLSVVNGAGQSLSKLALDATIQERVEEDVRTSTFARSDTVLQLAWVLGGGIALALPSQGTAGFALASVGMVLALVGALRHFRRRPTRRALTSGPSGL